MRRSSNFLLCSFLLTGCLARPPQEPHQESLPAAWKAPLVTLAQPIQEVHSYTTFEKSSLQWWELFKNEQLSQLIQEAYGSNFTLKMYYSRFEEALAAAGISLSDLYPHLTIDALAERNLVAKSKRIQTPVITGGTIAMPPPGSTAPPAFTPLTQKMYGPKFNNDLLLNLGLSYEVDLWGKYKMTYDASKERITESQEQYREAQLNLAGNIAYQFYRSLNYMSQLDLVKKQIKTLQELENIDKDRFQSGYQRKDQFLTSESLKNVALINKETLDLLKAQADDLLAVLAGLPPELYKGPTPPKTLYLPDMPTSIPSYLLLQRPDISALRAEVRARSLEIGVAEADRFPSFNIGAGVGFESNKANSLIKWKNHIWSLLGNMSYDLFDAGRKSSIVDLNKALFKESMNQYQERVLEAIKEVDDALFALNESRTNLATEEERNKELQERANLAKSRFNAGMVSKSEFLLQLVELLDEEQTLNQKKLTYFQSAISFLTAIGGSWEQK